MNVYIASFMLLLFNAVGVNPPAAAMATETAGNEVTSEAEATTPSDWGKVAQTFIQSEAPFAIRLQSGRDIASIWSVLPVQFTIGDKLEHEEGAP
ncbi:hypothetical protein [Sphingorhabdus sp. Alg231-15]|uniref:hypothetical protein n=1 Tax=Sphingorhabdus sp. Alg231-15 TaxID=1922222 RepID=UPI000D55AC2C